MSPQITLLPLSPDLHANALQEVYVNVPAYWAMYDLLNTPRDQAARDLAEAERTPGRTMMGIVKPVEPWNPNAGGEMIGLVDFRLHWPDARMTHIGMIMVAEPYQRQGVGSQAWHLLRPWLGGQAGIETARLGVEQFNVGTLDFFQHLGFFLTGESNRIQVGEKLVRLLYMEQALDNGE